MPSIHRRAAVLDYRRSSGANNSEIKSARDGQIWRGAGAEQRWVRFLARREIAGGEPRGPGGPRSAFQRRGALSGIRPSDYWP